MSKLFNRVRMTVSGTPGTGTITLLAAFGNSYFTFAEAGVSNGDVVSYFIEDGNNIEIGIGTYTSAGTTMSRDTVRISKIAGVAGTSKVTLTSNALVYISPAKEDLLSISETQTANRLLAGPTSGGAAAPTFRQLTAADMENQSANRVFAGPTSGGAAAPTFRALVTTDIPALSTGFIAVSKFTSGSAATFTPNANANAWRIRMVGPGAGGAGATANNGNASANDTTFKVNSDAATWQAVKGSGGTAGNGTAAGGAGGSGGTDGTTGTLVTRTNGGYGTPGALTVASSSAGGGNGGVSPFGGAGRGGASGGGGSSASTAGAAGTGSGGGGGYAQSNSTGGGGGGAGEYVEFWVTGMTTGTYTVGAGGTAGGAGTQPGAAGGSGCIIIEEFKFQ